jgi:hypothetical protein
MRLLAILLPGAVVAVLAVGAGPAGAVGTPDGYPRSIAGVGLADGVLVTRVQAQFRVRSDGRVSVNAYATATPRSGVAGRRLVLAVARCSGSASSPVCRAAASARWTLSAGRPSSVHRTFVVSRPAAPPDGLRVLALITRSASAPVPVCAAGLEPGARCLTDTRFTLGGDVLLSAGTWRHRPGTRYGTTVTAEGIAVDQVFFNSRRYVWLATSPREARARTTMGYPDQPPRSVFSTALGAGTPKRFFHTPSTGSAFETRAGVRTLTYTSTVDAQTLFTLVVPVPRWSTSA